MASARWQGIVAPWIGAPRLVEIAARVPAHHHLHQTAREAAVDAALAFDADSRLVHAQLAALQPGEAYDRRQQEAAWQYRPWSAVGLQSRATNFGLAVEEVRVRQRTGTWPVRVGVDGGVRRVRSGRVSSMRLPFASAGVEGTLGAQWRARLRAGAEDLGVGVVAAVGSAQVEWRGVGMRRVGLQVERRGVDDSRQRLLGDRGGVVAHGPVRATIAAASWRHDGVPVLHEAQVDVQAGYGTYTAQGLPSNARLGASASVLWPWHWRAIRGRFGARTQTLRFARDGPVVAGALDVAQAGSYWSPRAYREAHLRAVATVNAWRVSVPDAAHGRRGHSSWRGGVAHRRERGDGIESQRVCGAAPHAIEHRRSVDRRDRVAEWFACGLRQGALGEAGPARRAGEPDVQYGLLFSGVSSAEQDRLSRFLFWEVAPQMGHRFVLTRQTQAAARPSPRG